MMSFGKQQAQDNSTLCSSSKWAPYSVVTSGRKFWHPRIAEWMHLKVASGIIFFWKWEYSKRIRKCSIKVWLIKSEATNCECETVRSVLQQVPTGVVPHTLDQGARSALLSYWLPDSFESDISRSSQRVASTMFPHHWFIHTLDQLGADALLWPHWQQFRVIHALKPSGTTSSILWVSWHSCISPATTSTLYLLLNCSIEVWD